MIRAVVVMGMLGLAAAAARADGLDARALYERGTAHYNLGEWRPALDDFKEAYRLKRDPAFLFNLAQCYRQLGEPAQAQLEYRAYLREAPEAPNRAEVERLVVSMDEAVKAQKAQEPPTGTKPPRDASVAGAGTGATSAAAAAPVSAPAPLAAAIPLVNRERSRDGHAKRVAGIVLLAGGAATIALGGAFVGLAKAANDDAGARGVYDPRAEDRRDAFQTADAVCFVVGGAAVVAGAALTIAGRR
jgi:tetratricopeptide (TPR) repeat protein